MASKRMVLQLGMGTDIRGRDYTKAAVRALRDALWHNSLSVAAALGQPVDAMQVEVTIGVPRPELVDRAAMLQVLPHGSGTVFCGFTSRTDDDVAESETLFFGCTVISQDDELRFAGRR